MLLVLPIGCGPRSKPGDGQAGDAATVAQSSGDGAQPIAAQDAVAWPQYVDEASCADCHAEISRLYASHPMGNSIQPATERAAVPLGPTGRAVVTVGGYEYAIRREQGQLQVAQRRKTDDGRVANETVRTVHSVVGSGQHGQSLLVDLDQRLFMAPVTWYPIQDRWDLSPGYEVANSEFHRPVPEECLFCHSDRPVIDVNTLNHWLPDPGQQRAIGCQRCHGPGQEHVQAQQQSGNAGSGSAIVNPARLEPARRDAVCLQCHLAATVRIASGGQAWRKFRPGQKLEHLLAAYLAKIDPSDSDDSSTVKFVGHGQQMLMSRCYQNSNGQLSCISCHDPHGVPSPAERQEFYRERCLRCHGEPDSVECAMPLDDRRVEQPQDDCIACHMQARPTEVRHAAITDHTVPRFGGDHPSADTAPAQQRLRSLLAQMQARGALSDSSWPLVPVLLATDQRSVQLQQRDMAVALVALLADRDGLLDADQLNLMAEWLQRAWSQRRDVSAAIALVQVLIVQQREEQALSLLQNVLAIHPQHELAWLWASRLLSASGRLSEAAAAWQRTLAINPWMANYWYDAALVQARAGHWQRCQQLAGQAVERFPTSMGARHLLIQSSLQMQDWQAAQAAFEAMRAHRPSGFEAVEAWYGEQTSRRAR